MILKVLESHSCNLKAISDTSKSTALHLAAERGHLQVVEWLVEQGVSTAEKDARHNTAQVCAKINNHQDVFTLLKKHRAGLPSVSSNLPSSLFMSFYKQLI